MNSIIKKAHEMDEYKQTLPNLEIGEKYTLSDVWDGNGLVPIESYCYQLTDTDYINYEFEIIEEKDNALDNVICITNIDLV